MNELSAEHQETLNKLIPVALQALGVKGVINAAIGAMGVEAFRPEIIALVEFVKANDQPPAPPEEETPPDKTDA